MSKNKFYKRWYDDNQDLQDCIAMLASKDTALQKQITTFIVDHVLNYPACKEVLSEEIYTKAYSPSYRRNYDDKESCRIILEFLKVLPDEMRTEVIKNTRDFVNGLEH